IGRRSRHRNNPGVGPRPIEPRAVGGVEAHRQPVTALFRLIGENLAARVEPGHRFALVEAQDDMRSEEHTSELQSLMRNSYAVFCLKKKTTEETKAIYTQ